MRHAPTTDFTPAMPPLPPALADLSTPELVKIVIEEIGLHAKFADYQRHVATCHLTEEQVRVNVGAAQRLILLERAEKAGPPRPLMSWDADPSYRKELVQQAGRAIAHGLADTAAIVATLERVGIEPEAMIALWDDFISEAIRQVHAQPRVSLLARIALDLDTALTAYESPELNAEARQLARSMRAALEAIRGEVQVSRQHVLRTADAFADALDWAGFPGGHTPRVRTAVALLRKLWGL